MSTIALATFISQRYLTQIMQGDGRSAPRDASPRLQLYPVITTRASFTRARAPEQKHARDIDTRVGSAWHGGGDACATPRREARDDAHWVHPCATSRARAGAPSGGERAIDGVGRAEANRFDHACDRGAADERGVVVKRRRNGC